MNNFFYYFLNKIYIIIFLLISFFSPTGIWLGLIGFMVISDMFTGVIAASKQNIKIQSKRLSNTIYKTLIYFTSILLSFLIEYVFDLDIPIMKIVGAIIASVELKSIDENLKIILGVSIFDFLIKILKKERG